MTATSNLKGGITQNLELDVMQRTRLEMKLRAALCEWKLDSISTQG